jgi:hypothetical protein
MIGERRDELEEDDSIASPLATNHYHLNTSVKKRTKPLTTPFKELDSESDKD